MQRINSRSQVASTGRVRIDAGDGIQLEVPVTPTDARDTGTLTVTSTFPQITRGSVTVRRVGPTVYVTLLDVEFATSTPPEFFYLTGLLPVGYRPSVFTSFPALADVNGTITRRIRFQPDGQILLYAITATNRINVTASYLTPDAFPA